MKKSILGLILLISSLSIFAAENSPKTIKNYQKHCSSCHGEDRLGRTGVALLPENLKRFKKDRIKKVIKFGKPASQMFGFKDKLTDLEIDGLVKLIYTPLKEVPIWGEKEIKKTYKVLNSDKNFSNKPIFKVKDKLNLFIVVELEDHSATLLDGDSFEVITRFKTRPNLHGGPKFSADGRYVYFASRDGWVSKYDIYNLKMLYEVRAGINTRNLALSADGETVLIGNYLPNNLVVLNAKDLSFKHNIKVQSDGKNSRVSAVYTAPKRKSYVAALKDIKEIWEIPYTEANKQKTPKITKIKTNKIIDDFFFSQDYKFLIGGSREGGKGVVINLDNHKEIAQIDLDGMPHLGSGISFNYKKDEMLLATQNLRKNEITFVSLNNWKVVKKLKTPGPGFFMRSHENSAYIFADVFFGKNKEKILVIDKKTLQIVKAIIPAPGKTSSHIELDRSGRFAFVSVWENLADGGALVIYDTKTFEEVKRIPMRKPSGKYNIYNKINFSEGTSH